MKVQIDRRRFLHMGSLAAAAATITPRAWPSAPRVHSESLFDGHTLSGWIQLENNATAFSSSAIIDPVGLIQRLQHPADPISTYLRPHVTAALAVTAESNSNAIPKPIISEMARQLTDLINGPPIYDPDRFSGVALRAETRELLRRQPTGGQALVRLNKLLLEDAFPALLARSVSEGWTVNDGAISSLGTGRGVIYTGRDFERFRITFTMRHLSGNPDHQACVLLFCTRPDGSNKPLDALGGIQFQVPNGGHWDYRIGMNNDGGAEFTRVAQTHFNPHDWSRVEIVADAHKGVARMAVAQPVGSKGVHVLDFSNPSAGKAGPFALQMHNAGLFDQYKDIAIEENPASNDLLLLD